VSFQRCFISVVKFVVNYGVPVLRHLVVMLSFVAHDMMRKNDNIPNLNISNIFKHIRMLWMRS